MEEQFTKSIIVKADVKDVYNAWSNFENFPLFMKNIKTVCKTGGMNSHWEMQGPLGVKVKWEAETTLMEPNKRIGWSTKDNTSGNITTSGQVTFNQLTNEEIEIVATVHYGTRACLTGKVVAKLIGNPEEKLEEDLRNFKEYIEDVHSNR